MAKPTGPRVLIYDIETSLQTVTVFGLKYNDFIDPSNIVTERHVISICWRWLGEKTVQSVSLLDDPKRFAKDIHDDTHVLTVFHKVLSEADVIVAHNGDQFDLKYLKTRMLFHKLPVLPPITSVDTYKVAKQEFAFNSNKLDYLGTFLGFGGKASTPKGLWADAWKGDKTAIRTMVAYNKRDVVLLEKVYLALRPYVRNHVNGELFGTVGCTKCGSKKIQFRGLHQAVSRVYRRFHCQSCGGWGRLVINEKTVKTQYRSL